MIALQTAILILASARVLLVEGGIEIGNLTDNETKIDDESSRRILFGRPVTGTPFPYLVGLTLAGTACVGSIIANHWILTAAHCLFGTTCSQIEIFTTVWRAGESVKPARCLSHEKYRAHAPEYDIGLLRLEQDILRDGRAKSINLPPPGKVYPPGTAVTIVGWGVTEKNVWSYQLLEAKVRIDKWENCNTQYLAHAESGGQEIPRRILCLEGIGEPPAGTCHGDSGGPAITNDGFTIGISSFGLINKNGHCLLGGPSMFVNLPDYLPWIYRHIDPSRDTSKYPVKPEHDVP